MAQHFEGGGAGWVVSDEQYYLDRMQHVAEKVQEILPYGPLTITTEYPDIPGAKYGSNGFYAPKTTTFHDSEVTVTGIGETTEFVIETDAMSEPVTLGLGHIVYAGVDHPLGRRMPLHGRSVPSPVILERDRMTLIEWAPRFIEYGRYERADAGIHPEFSGIGVVKLHAADTCDNQWRKVPQPTLDEAMAATEEKGHQPMTFLISALAKGRRAIVTSRIGYNQTRAVFVRPPEAMADEPIAIEMVDFAAGITEDKLVEHHIERLQSWRVKGDPNYPRITPMQRDELFLYATSD